jgi:hypothetical protein
MLTGKPPPERCVQHQPHHRIATHRAGYGRPMQGVVGVEVSAGDLSAESCVHGNVLDPHILWKCVSAESFDCVEQGGNALAPCRSS